MITHDEVKVLDANAAARGVPTSTLMENAGKGVAEAMMKEFDLKGKTVLILCGTGNNGGDGLVAARLLRKVCKVKVFLVGDPKTQISKSNLSKVKALVFQSQDWLARYPDQAKLKEALSKVDFSAAFATHRIPELDFVTLVLPQASYVEKDGSFTNYEGRVQKIQRCFPTREDAKPGWQIMASLAKKAGRELDVNSAADAFKMLAGEVPAFRGLTLDGLPSTGTVVPIK